MCRILCMALLAASLPAAADQSARSPILVELFTSEGCSDCPPADRLLELLDPQAVVLSEHVDYWNHDGWKDPFSSARFTERQQLYAAKFKLESTYTPQMVIDGAVQVVGNNRRRVEEEVENARRRSKVDVRLTRADAGVRVQVQGAPADVSVFLAIADESADSQVLHGENSGRRLHHVAVARSIRRVGRVAPGGSYDQTVGLPAGARRQRILVWLQAGETAPVAGAAVLTAQHEK